NDRSHIDDTARTLFHHHRSTSVDKVESRFQVDTDDGIPLTFTHTHHQTVFRDTSIVYEDIHTTEIFYDFSNDIVCFFEIGRIGSIAFCFNTQCFDFLLGGQTVFVDHQIRECDICTLCGEFQCDRLTNTTCGPRNDCHFTF